MTISGTNFIVKANVNSTNYKNNQRMTFNKILHTCIMATLHVAIVITYSKQVICEVIIAGGLLLMWSPWGPPMMLLVSLVSLSLLLGDVVGHVQSTHREGDECV